MATKTRRHEDFLIVNACIPDAQDIAAIRRKTFSHFAPQSYSAKEVQTLLDDLDMDHLLQMIRDKKMFVVKDGERIVGSAGWDEQSIRHVYVDPDYARQGIASRLLEHTEQDYSARTGHSEIAAGISIYAKEFYEANGYDFVSEATDWDGSTYYKMKKIFVPSCLQGSKNV